MATTHKSYSERLMKMAINPPWLEERKNTDSPLLEAQRFAWLVGSPLWVGPAALWGVALDEFHHHNPVFSLNPITRLLEKKITQPVIGEIEKWHNNFPRVVHKPVPVVFSEGMKWKRPMTAELKTEPAKKVILSNILNKNKRPKNISAANSKPFNLTFGNYAHNLTWNNRLIPSSSILDKNNFQLQHSNTFEKHPFSAKLFDRQLKVGMDLHSIEHHAKGYEDAKFGPIKSGTVNLGALSEGDSNQYTRFRDETKQYAGFASNKNLGNFAGKLSMNNIFKQSPGNIENINHNKFQLQGIANDLDFKRPFNLKLNYNQ